MGFVNVRLTNGFGNNIFQYVAARKLAEFLESELIVSPPNPHYYAISDLAAIGIEVVDKKIEEDMVLINDRNYQQSFSSKKLKGAKIFLTGYFEDYTHYLSNIEEIKTWFPPIEKRNNKDLVVHVRTGDRLFMKNEFYGKPRAKNYIEAIEKFNFNRLYIVTDMPKWEEVTKEELAAMKFHCDVSQEQRVPIEESVSYINEMIKGLSRYDPFVHKGSIVEDFNFIRGSRNILFEHGTLSWWASILSEAEKVGVYGPWRPWKGVNNKNLSDVPLENWFKWR